MDHCTCLVCSMASEVIKVVQLLEVTNWERRLWTQGCGGAEMKLFCSSACAPCATGRSGALLLGEEWDLAVTLNWSPGLWREFPPCCGFLCNLKESLLVSVSCFSNCVIRWLFLTCLSVYFIYATFLYLEILY